MPQDKKGPEDGDRETDPVEPDDDLLDDDLLDDDEIYLKAKDRGTDGHRERAHGGDEWPSEREHRKRDRRPRRDDGRHERDRRDDDRD